VRSSFPARLALIVVAAAALRLVYALAFAPHTAGAVDDGFWYQEVSRNVADGRGFVVPLGSFDAGTFHLEPTAEHGPLYPLALAAARELGLNADAALRALGALFGALTVTAVGLLGRRFGGERLGLLAAGIAAVSPLLIAADGALTSETLYAALIAGLLLAAVRFADAPGPGRGALLGVAIGLAALTRSEALLLLPLLALPLAWRGGRPGRALRLAAPLLCAALVLAPWVARNASVFHRPVLTNNEGDLLAASNCNRTYHGRDLGYVNLLCLSQASGNEAQKAAHWRREGLGYARDHAGRLIVVAPVRLLRTAGLYQPFRSAHERSRSDTLTKLGVLFDFGLMVLAVWGAVVLRRRGMPLLVLLAPIAMVCLTVLATYGAVRFRHAAEIPLVLLAGAGLLALVERVRGRQPAATAASASSRVA
jgi:4-amino-4-deoxy-L-arabinose transferase-like glycosyltransferase